MATVLKKVERDLSTTILDFNTLPLRLYDIDLGEYTEDPQGSGSPPSSDYPIELQNRTLPEVVMRIGAEGSTMDAYITAARALTAAIKEPGTYMFQPQGASKPLYFDGFPGRIPSPFRTQEDLHSFIINKFRDPYGLELTIPRMPYLFAQNVLASLQPFANATMLGDSDNNGRPDGWSWTGGNPTGEAIDGTLQAYRFTHATTGNRDLVPPAGGVSAVGSYAPGDYAVAQLEAATLIATIGNARIQILIEFMASNGTTSLATHTQTLQVLTDSFSKLSFVTPSAAPASTSRVRVTYRVANLAATSTTMMLRRAMVEKTTVGGAPSSFRVGPEVVSNDPADASSVMGKAMFVYVTGNAPTRARITITPESGTNGGKFVQARVGKRGYGDLPAFVNQVMFRQAESADLTGTSTAAVVSDSGASGSQVLQIFNPGTGGVDDWAVRAKFQIAPATKSAVEGKFRVFARCKLEDSEPELAMALQLKWAPGNADPPSFSNRPVALDLDSDDGLKFASKMWFALDLGTVSVEAGVLTTYGLTLHLWARRWAQDGSTPASALLVDHLFLMPVGGSITSALDQSMILATRGFLDDDGGSPTHWDGNDLRAIAASSYGITAPGHNDGRTKVLAESEGTGTPPNSGFKVVNGRHVVSVNATLIHPRDDDDSDPQKDWLGSLIVRQVSVTAQDLKAVKLVLTSKIGRKRKRFRLTFDRPGTDPSIQYQVINHSADTQYSGTGTIRVHDLNSYYLRYVSSPDSMYVSGEYNFVSGRPVVQVISSAGLQVDPLRVRGAWIDLTPGLNVLMFDWGDIPYDEWFDADVRGPLPSSGNLSADTSGSMRKATVAVDYYERWQ